MAGGNHASEPEFKGWQKTFNTYTHRGRLHVAYASIAIWTTTFLVIKFWPSSKKAVKQ